MTISKYIAEFIKQFENIAIDTNHIKDGSDKYGLFKSPARDKKVHLDDSTEITEYYQFLAKQNAVSEADRKDSDEWLEEFTYWIDDYSYYNRYPELDNGRTVLDIVATGSPTPMQTDDEEILYQIALAITYTRELEE